MDRGFRAVGSASISLRVSTWGCPLWRPVLHRDCLPHRAHLHFAIYGDRDVRRDIDGLPIGGEPRRGEGHAVGARANIHDGVASFAVGCDSARTFYERRAGSFDFTPELSRTYPEMVL